MINNFISNTIFWVFLAISDITHIPTRILTYACFILAVVAFIDIFAGDGYYPTNMPVGNRFLSLRSNHKLFPTYTDIILLLLFGMIGAFSFFYPI